MAIEVIEQTPYNPNDKFECTCPYCKSKVVYTRQDITPHRHHPFGYITCPACQKVISHNESYLLEKGEGVYHGQLIFDPRKYITRAQKKQYEGDIRRFKTSLTVLCILSGVSLLSIFISIFLDTLFLIWYPNMYGGEIPLEMSIIFTYLFEISIWLFAVGFIVFLGLGLGINIPKISNRKRHLRKKIYEDELEKHGQE